MKPPTGPLRVVVLLMVIGIVSAFFTVPRYCCGLQPSQRPETIKKVEECIEHWRPECADLDFRPLYGIGRWDLIRRLPASALSMPPRIVVCEEDWKDWIEDWKYWVTCPPICVPR